MAGLDGEEVAAAAAVEARAVVLSLEWGSASFGEEMLAMESLWMDDEEGWVGVVSEGLCAVLLEICPRGRAIAAVRADPVEAAVFRRTGRSKAKASGQA